MTPGGNAWASSVSLNTYSPNGVRSIRFNLASSSGGFLDLSTLAIQAQVNEKGGVQALTFLGPNLGCMIQELRIYLGGVLCEAIPYYNRVEEMLARFKSHDKRIEDYDCGFGYHNGTRDGSSYVAKSIPADGSKVVVWQPSACGLCAQRKYLPTTFIPGGATLEILLVNTQQEVVDSNGSSF